MDDSPLGALPAELRSEIWTHALRHGQRCIEIRSPLSWSNKTSPHPLALMQTCKAIHAECSKMFYAVNDFVILCEEEEDKIGLLDHFFARIGKQHVAILPPVVLRIGDYSKPNDEKRLGADIVELLAYCNHYDTHISPALLLEASEEDEVWWTTVTPLLQLRLTSIAKVVRACAEQWRRNREVTGIRTIRRAISTVRALTRYTDTLSRICAKMLPHTKTGHDHEGLRMMMDYRNFTEGLARVKAECVLDLTSFAQNTH
jgi:hypothetical protein